MIPAALLALTSSTWYYRTDTSQPRSTSDWSGLRGPVSPHLSAPLSLKSLSSSNIRWCFKAALGTLKAHPDNKKKAVMIYSASGSDSYNCLPWELFWSVHESTDWQHSTMCHHQAFMGSLTVSSAARLILLSPVYLFYVSLWLCQSKLHFINLLIGSIHTAEIKLMKGTASLNASRTSI